MSEQLKDRRIAVLATDGFEQSVTGGRSPLLCPADWAETFCLRPGTFGEGFLEPQD